MSSDVETPPDAPVLRVRDLQCAYGNSVVLHGVSFDVAPREVFVVLGNSGSGKSTLMRNIVGLEQPVAGTVEIDGLRFDDATGQRRKDVLRRMGVLFQSGALFSSMTLSENVGLQLEEFTSLPPVAIREIASLKLGMVGLAGYEEYLPDEVSGGMRKRAALARALAMDPKLLFFDEPSAGLDPITSVELDELILGLRDALGTTLVIVTHELSSIYGVADRCIVLDSARRRVVAEGHPHALRDQSTDPFVRAFFNRTPLGAGATAASSISGES